MSEPAPSAGEPVEPAAALRDSRVLRMRLVAANASPPIQGDGGLTGKVNYFLGNDPSRWRTNIPTFAKVQYRGVYPGTDLLYYGNRDGRLEYDFVLAPGADPSLIVLEFDGADRIELDASGDLVAWVGGRPVRWQKPVVYQEFNGRRTEIAGAYRLYDGALAFQANSAYRIGFEVAAYDRSQPLVIDPVLVYSTYLGGAQSDDAGAITTDAQGNAIVVGSTSSIDFPTRNALDPNIDGATDAFVAKLSSSGELLHGTYLGGGSREWAMGVQLDRAGNIHLAGVTRSTNYPVVNPLQAVQGGEDDLILTILSPDGSAIHFSTYLGGSGSDGAGHLALDELGNIYAAGWGGLDFPMHHALQPYNQGGAEGLVVKMEAGGKRLLYSTWFGGSGAEILKGIVVDAEGNAYIVGSTSSYDLPIRNAPQPFYAGNTDFFYAKFLPDGSDLVYGSYFGGDDYDIISGPAGVALGPDGALWIAGQCNSRGLATEGVFQTDYAVGPVSILARFNAANGALVAATYFDSAYAETMAVDARGEVWIGGRASETLTLRNPIQAQYGGSGTNWFQAADGYVAKFSADLSALLFCTYFGGSQGEEIASIAVDPKGDLVISGDVGYSPGFPIINAFQPQPGGKGEGFVAKISLAEVLKISRVGRDLMFTWPKSATGYQLESANTLGPGAAWNTVAQPPVAHGDEQIVTLPIESGARFFRLRK